MANPAGLWYIQQMHRLAEQQGFYRPTLDPGSDPNSKGFWIFIGCVLIGFCLIMYCN